MREGKRCEDLKKRVEREGKRGMRKRHRERERKERC